MNADRITAALVGVVILAATSGCAAKTEDTASEERAGGAGPSDPSVPTDLVADAPSLDHAAEAALEVGDFDAADPRFPLANLKRFDAVVLGTVEEFVAGPVQPVVAGEPDPIRTVVLRLRATAPLGGDVAPGDTVYVRLAVDDLDGLQRALPEGTPALVAVSAVDETVDEHLTDPYAGVPEGEQRYIAGAPYAAFADGSAKTWFPLLGLTVDAPLTDLVPPQLEDKLP